MLENDKKRIDELKELIEFYDKQYYNKGRSDISDAEYDRLYEEYLEFERKYPELKQEDNAPSRRVGSGTVNQASLLPKYTHKSPLLSINNKSRELEDLKAFYEGLGGDGTTVIVEPKLDGITCNINYEQGLLINAATRGNGYIGDVITDNFENTETKYPQTLLKNMSLELRGEAVIPYAFFKKNLSKSYSNPRNAVAGIMRSLNPDDVKNKGIHVMFYDIGKNEGMMLEDSDYKNLETIKMIKFESIPVIKVNNWKTLEETIKSNFNGMIQNVDGFNVLIVDKYTQAVCDGLVIKADSLKLRNKLGMTEKGPRWAFAYKFKPLQAQTRIDHIEWQVGKTGVITPVGVFDPISLGGVTITKATLNNEAYMRQLPVLHSNEEPLMVIRPFDISFEKQKKTGIQCDDAIIVERSNDVIPRIAAIHHRGNFMASHHQDGNIAERKQTFKPLETCPVCGHPVIKKGPQIYCVNPECSAQMLGKFENFVSRDAMNITGLGSSALKVFLEEGFLDDFVSIYEELPKRRTEIASLDGFGVKKVDNLIKSIEKSRKIPLARFIYALSIPGVGIKTAKDLARTFQNVTRFLDGSYEELLQIEGLSGVGATAIIDWIQNEDNIKLVNHLLKYISIENDKKVISNVLEGKTFAITGTLKKPRKFYQETIESLSGKVSNNISKKTDVVLIGEEAGSKEIKAKELQAKGYPILLLNREEDIEQYFEKLTKK